MPSTILRLPEVIYKTGLSRSSIYLKIASGDFPESISLGKRAVGWIESEVEDWIQERVTHSRSED